MSTNPGSANTNPPPRSPNTKLPGGRGRLPAPGSHRSGRAQFAHPAPHAMDSQDLNGYPLSSRADGAGAQCLRHLSLERFHGTASPSLHRVSHRPGFPGFDGTMGCSESLPPVPPHFVAFVWRYHMRAGSFAPVGCPARGLPQAGAHWSPGCPRVRGSHVETAGPPRFLGNPLCTCPALRPRRDRGRQASTAPRCCLPSS